MGEVYAGKSESVTVAGQRSLPDPLKSELSAELDDPARTGRDHSPEVGVGAAELCLVVHVVVDRYRTGADAGAIA